MRSMRRRRRRSSDPRPSLRGSDEEEARRRREEAEAPSRAHLRRVPEIAGNHHERMDGRGYPRQVKLSEASIEERVMALADVFEALTASDRPYKVGLSLSRALEILADMVSEGHLDAQLFLLLLDSGVWRRYADSFVASRQRDDVDLAAIKARATRAASSHLGC